MLKSIFKKYKSFLVRLSVWILILAVVILIYVLKNPNQIYHASYLDKLYDEPQNTFVAKYTIFNPISCQEIENWAKDNIDYSKFQGDITFISYSDEIDENYRFLKKDYHKTLWSNLRCEINSRTGKCYHCREWYE